MFVPMDDFLDDHKEDPSCLIWRFTTDAIKIPPYTSELTQINRRVATHALELLLGV